MEFNLEQYLNDGIMNLILNVPHTGGCVLFEHEDAVAQMINNRN